MSRKHRNRPSCTQRRELVSMFPNTELESVRATIARYPVAHSFAIDREARNRQGHLVRDHFAVFAQNGADISLFWAIHEDAI